MGQKSVSRPMGWGKLAFSFWCDGLIRERLDRRRKANGAAEVAAAHSQWDDAVKCAVNGMDISAWLRSLGLERYEQAFRENAIDEAILPKLTGEDLRDLGVTAVGHRRILLDAIAALRVETFRDVAEYSVELDRSAGKAPEAERRQLTVMFADLVGSTALSARLDPEELRDIIGTYHRRCAEVITRSGGFVAKYLGDGVVAYFGYPQAHEEDAEQAVRAGLALIEAVAKLDAGQATSLRVRVGIATAS